MKPKIKGFGSAVDKRLQKEGDPQVTSILAKAGDTNGNIDVPNRPGYIYARGLDGVFYQVASNVEDIRYDQPIRIAPEKGDKNRMRVVKVWDTYGNPLPRLLDLHGPDHSYGGRDPSPIWLAQFMWWKISPVEDLILQVYRPSVRPTGGDVIYSTTELLDMSSHVPVAGAIFCLIEVLDDGTLNVVEGDPVADKYQLREIHIPPQTTGSRMLYAVVMYTGQTKFIITRTWTDFVDLRFSEMPGGGGGAGLIDGDYGDITVSGGGTVMTIDVPQLPLSYLDTDTTLAANSDAKVASQKAIKTYVNNVVAGLLEFKGSTDCSANPNYPAALKGDAYVVTVAGKIGGASGKSVDVSDLYVAIADNAGGTEASVGTSWIVLEHNLVGALLSANNLSDVTSATTALTNLGLTSNGKSLITAADYAAMRTLLDVVPRNGWVPISATATSGTLDSPSFEISFNADMTGIIGLGDRLWITQGTSKYFIVTKVGAYGSGATIITCYGGTDYTLVASGTTAITAPYYSHEKSPYGFPTSPEKWTYTAINDTTLRTQASPTAGTWYNLGSLSSALPIGAWSLQGSALPTVDRSSGNVDIYVTLSTANNTESDASLTKKLALRATMTYAEVSLQWLKPITLTTKTTYYANAKVAASSITNIYYNNSAQTMLFNLVCAYL